MRIHEFGKDNKQTILALLFVHYKKNKMSEHVEFETRGRSGRKDAIVQMHLHLTA